MELEERGSLINIDTLLELLGNPTRRIILAKLAKVPHATSELARSLDISRQAVHQQLEILNNNKIIERISDEKRGVKYRIKSNLSIRIDIAPDYYDINYSISEVDEKTMSTRFKDIGCEVDYKNIKSPNNKIRFIGEKIKSTEDNINILEKKRKILLNNKECFIRELKNIMTNKYDKKLRREQPNLEKEIFFTMFFNPDRYFKRINIDSLLDDMFFSGMDLIRRDMTKVSIDHLLRDLSKFMDFLREDEDDWFFDI